MLWNCRLKIRPSMRWPARVDARSKASSARDVAVAYCQGTPLRNEIEARDATALEDATKQAEKALAERFGGAAVDGRIQAIVMTAIR